MENKLKSSTVKSYISAIKSVLQQLGEKISETNYLLKSLTQVCRLRNDTIVNRLPISRQVLRLILNSLRNLFTSQPYLLSLYSSLFSAAFYGLLRIGEVAKSPHVLLVKNVHIGQNKNKLLFILQSSKTHGKGDKPQLIKIKSKARMSKEYGEKSLQQDSEKYCPFQLAKNFIAMRPNYIDAEEQFYVFVDWSPVLQSQVRKVFHSAIKSAGLCVEAYSFHCLRSGRASCLLELGLSVETIKKLGRWKSNAIFTYLRT